MAPLFKFMKLGDDEDLQSLIRDHLILPYFWRFPPLPHT